MVPLPPSPFNSAIHKRFWKPGEAFVRVHDSRFTGNTFNPGLGRPSRFAPLFPPHGGNIPTAYCASTFECAIAETIFHEIPHNAAFKHIPERDFEHLDCSVVEPKRNLGLVTLFEPDLNNWGFTRSQLIDTLASKYSKTALRALAIHDLDQTRYGPIDGLIWTSRRCDPELAVVLFGDRVGTDDLQVKLRESLVKTPRLLSAVHGFASRAGITLTR